MRDRVIEYKDMLMDTQKNSEEAHISYEELARLTENLPPVPKFDSIAQLPVMGNVIEYVGEGTTIGFPIIWQKGVAVQKAFMTSRAEIETHVHEFSNEILIVISGRLIVTINKGAEKESVTVVEEGDSITIKRNTPHFVMAAIDTWSLAITLPADKFYPQLSTYKFMIAYNDTTTNDGWVRVLNASTSYVMTDYASLEHEATYCNDSVVLGISSNSAILVYTGASYDGFLKTFGPCTSKISIDGEWRNIIGMQICVNAGKVNVWHTVTDPKISISSSWEDVLLAEDF